MKFRNIILGVSAAALIAGAAIAARAGNTTFFTSIGDIVFPFTAPTNNPSAPGTIDNMTIGATTPAPGTFTTLKTTTPVTRPLNLSDARLDSGIVSTSATGTSTAFGVARTAGTSYALVGAATSSSAVTTKAFWEATVASTGPGGVVNVVVNANYTGGGTVTAASTTLTVAAYTEVGGVETAISGITAAQQFTGTAANYTFAIPAAASLVAGQHIGIEVSMLVTTSAGAATGQINGVSVSN